MAKLDIQLGLFKNSKLILKKQIKILSVYNYHMYFHFKFHIKLTYNAKVMSKKSPIQGQGDKKKGQVFLATTL